MFRDFAFSFLPAAGKGRGEESPGALEGDTFLLFFGWLFYFILFQKFILAPTLLPPTFFLLILSWVLALGNSEQGAFNPPRQPPGDAAKVSLRRWSPGNKFRK